VTIYVRLIVSGIVGESELFWTLNNILTAFTIFVLEVRHFVVDSGSIRANTRGDEDLKKFKIGLTSGDCRQIELCCW
jgi:hypothetical protein